MTSSRKKPVCLGAEETSLFCFQAAMVLKSGISMGDGLTALCDDFRDTRSGPLLAKLAEALEETGSLSAALEQAPVLPAYAVNMITIGERAGKLDDVLTALGQSYDRENRVRRNLRQAVLYPAVLTLLMGAIIAVVVFFVLPVFTQVLRSLGAGLYGTADSMMRVGMGIGVTAMVLVGLLVLAAIALGILMQTKARTRVRDWLCRYMPVVRKVAAALQAERFASVMGMLMGSGYPLDEALPMISELAVMDTVREKVEHVRQAVEQGEAFSEAVAGAGIFDSLHARMLRAGASAGQMDKVFERLCDVYHERFEREVSNAEALVEPLLVAVLAVVAGAILLSVMLPLAGMLASMM